MIRNATTEINLSVRGHDQILKVSRTVADFAASDPVTPEHVSEAIQCRTFDRTPLGVAEERQSNECLNSTL
ncbi:MAG: hypothetical protein WAO00_14945 [Chthoniobacterales bacterium]